LAAIGFLCLQAGLALLRSIPDPAILRVDPVLYFDP
jgi:hypothetical protein